MQRARSQRPHVASISSRDPVFNPLQVAVTAALPSPRLLEKPFYRCVERTIVIIVIFSLLSGGEDDHGEAAAAGDCVQLQ